MQLLNILSPSTSEQTNFALKVYSRVANNKNIFYRNFLFFLHFIFGEISTESSSMPSISYCENQQKMDVF